LYHLFDDSLSKATKGDPAVKNTYEEAVLETQKKFFTKDLKEAFKEGDFNRLVKQVVHLKKNNHTRKEIKYWLCLTESELRKIERSLSPKKSK
jgi:hypothetical protein